MHDRQSNRGFHGAALLVLALVVPVACGGPPAAAPSTTKAPIKIGGMWDFTGSISAVMTSIAHATQLEIDDVNAHGGINGHQIQLINVDDASDPATGVANYHKLVDQDQVNLLLGPDYTPVSLAVSNLAQKDKVLMYSPGGSAPAMTSSVQKYIFATPPTAEESGAAIAKLLLSMGKKHVGVIEEADAYGLQNTAALTAALQGKGATIDTKTQIAATAIDATSQVVKMKQASVDVVVIGVTENPANAIVKAAYQQQLGVPIISFQAGYQPSVEQLLFNSAPVEYYAATPLDCPLGVSGCAQSFVTRYQAKFSDKVTPFSIVAFAGVEAYVAALKRATAYDSDSVAKALEAAPAFKSALAPNIQYTASSHRGIRTQFMVGYKNAKMYFFGGDINTNTLKS